MKTYIDWPAVPGSQYPIITKLRLKPTCKKNKNQRIYRDDTGRYYHKDALHGEVEVYNKLGDHIGVMTPEGDRHPKKGRDKRKTIKGIV